MATTKRLLRSSGSDPQSGREGRKAVRLLYGEAWPKAALLRVRGRERVDMVFTFEAAACNLIRLPKLLAP